MASIPHKPEGYQNEIEEKELDAGAWVKPSEGRVTTRSGAQPERSVANDANFYDAALLSTPTGCWRVGYR